MVAPSYSPSCSSMCEAPASSQVRSLYAVYQRIVTDIFNQAAGAVARENTLEAQARVTGGLGMNCPRASGCKATRRCFAGERQQRVA
jgi:hypothetical protein